MLMRLVLGTLLILLAAQGLLPASAAHPGGLNAEGCHNNRRTGDYHCHRAATRSQPKASFEATGGSRSFRNCAAARAAGAAPVRLGRPGYARQNHTPLPAATDAVCAAMFTGAKKPAARMDNAATCSRACTQTLNLKQSFAIEGNIVVTSTRSYNGCARPPTPCDIQ